MLKSPSLKHFFVLFTIIVTATIVLFWTKPVKQLDLNAARPLSVIVKPVELSDVSLFSRVNGVLEPARRSVLQFQVGGLLAEKIVLAGQRVKKDDVLARIELGDYQDLRDEAKIKFNSESQALLRDKKLYQLIKDSLGLQQNEVNRLKKLGKGSLASQSALDAASQKLLQLKIELENLSYRVATAVGRVDLGKLQLSRAERNLRRTQLRAPYAGRINWISRDPGDSVGPNVDILEIVSDKEVAVRLQLNRALVEGLKIGQSVDINVGELIEVGKIFAIQVDPDQKTLTYRVDIRLSTQTLNPGLPVSVNIPGSQFSQVVKIPVSAVLVEESGAYAFTVVNNKLRKVAIQLGPRQETEQIVFSGLENDDLIVTKDVFVLAPDLEVSFEAP